MSFLLVIGEPPANVTAYNTSSTSIMVQWKPSAIPDIKLSGYEVLFKPRHNASAQWDTTIACNKTLNVTLKNLEKFTEYEILVSAFNEQGPGNFSEAVTCFTDEDSEWKIDRFVSVVWFIIKSFILSFFSSRVCSFCLCCNYHQLYIQYNLLCNPFVLKVKTFI